MRIGVLVSYDSKEQLEQKFKLLVDNDFDNCQLNCWKPELFNRESADYVLSLCEKYNITISALWCGWVGPAEWNFYEGHTTLGLLPKEWREVRIGNLCDGSDFCKMLGVKNIVTHMGFIPENPFDPEFEPFCDAVRTVAEHCKANGQNLLFETGQETPVTMLRCFEKVGTDNLRVNLDTANLILYGKGNPVDALDVFGKYVRNLHAKDGLFPTNGSELGVEVRLGDGKADFEKLFAKLHELDYNGFVTIEREIEGDQQTEDILYARRYLENIITKIYGCVE